ncbi:MAG: acetate--CoA ligase [Candidatus Harrisonbacteria bacterium]|nr:acetate--CoA ligase [Candidatus Harrisonbacteria bacterium]
MSQSLEQFQKVYAESIKDPEKFWANIAGEEIQWFQKWKKVFSWDYPNYQWFVGGRLNITHNCLDRHISAGKGDTTALIYLNEKYKKKTISYRELLRQVNKFANGLKSLGVKKGDMVVLYMPLVIEQAVAMLGCARIGAVHSVVFAGFSANALRERIEDCAAKVVVTSTWTLRRGEKKELKSTVEEAIENLGFVRHVIVLQRDGEKFELIKEKEVDFKGLMEKQSGVCEPEEMDSEDVLFVLYTSGSTGKPKGIVHTVGGYSVYTHYTTKKVFDIREDDIFWCTADFGWITGHSYVLYGPLSNGVASVMVEGAPDYPAPDHWYKIIAQEKISVFYTSPTALRMLRKYGEANCKKHNFSSLRVLGTVGEPINPEVWLWYQKNIGADKLPIEDTWWQTETAGHMIVTLPGLRQKPGKAGKPFFGIDADVVDASGNRMPVNGKGFLVIRKPWPSALRDCLNNHERFEKYWNEIKGVYFSGDFAIKDEDGDIQVLGRSDDVMNVSGHRIGSAEIENALVSHPAVSEAAVIGKPDEIRGAIVKAFVVLRKGQAATDALKAELQEHCRTVTAPYKYPREIEFISELPKTISGKIRRVELRR